MPHRSKQDFARLTDEALGTVMAPFPSWGSAKEGPGPKYFYKSLLLICSSLLSRQMCAANSAARAHKSARALRTLPHIPLPRTNTRVRISKATRARPLKVEARSSAATNVYMSSACATTMLAIGTSGSGTGAVTGASWLRRGAPPTQASQPATVTDIAVESIAAIGEAASEPPE